MKHIYAKTSTYAEHYFHFLYGYLMPFLMAAEPDDSVYLFDSCGPVMNRIILDLPGYRTAIRSDQEIDQTIELPSYDNPEFKDLDFAFARNRVFGVYDEELDSDRKGVLFVSRSEPHPFYLEEAGIKGAGSQRRSVPNLTHIFETVSSRARCRMISPEDMTLKEQIAAFRDASCIVLQHGAAMGNLLWCRPGASVIEIGDEEQFKYYSRLVEMMNLRRIRIPQDRPHAAVDAEKVVDSALKMTTIL